MKRSRLNPGKPLARTTPLERSSRLRSSGPTKPKRRPTEASEALGRRLVYARSGDSCEARLPQVCLGRATNWHHRVNRSQGGTWAASNGLHVCGSGTTGCHGVLTNTNGLRSYLESLGLVCRSGAVTTEVRVRLHWDRMVLLDDEGGWADAEVRDAS